MIDLNKEEYVYLLIVRTQSIDAIPFKSRNDIEKAILNIIANNIKNHTNDIANISYNYEFNLDTFICAKIEYKNGISKTYEGKRRHIEEVK